MIDVIDILMRVHRVLLIVRVAFNPIFPAFNKLELRVLQEIGKSIKIEHKEVFFEHIEKINVVQRYGGGREVKMFCWKFPGYYHWARSKYITSKDGSVKAVKFSLLFNTGEVIHGSLISIDGVLCNMSFGEPLGLYKRENLLEIKIKHSALT